MYFGLQHSKEDQRPNAMQGEARMQSLPGFPSVVQNSPQGYIDQLLAQNGAAAATHPDIFSPLNQQEGHNLPQKTETSLPRNIVLLPKALACW